MCSLSMMARISSGGAGDPAITPESERRLTQLPASPGPADPLHLQLLLENIIALSPLTLDLFLHLATGLGLVSRDAGDLPPSHPLFCRVLLPPKYLAHQVSAGLATLGPTPPPHMDEMS